MKNDEDLFGNDSSESEEEVDNENNTCLPIRDSDVDENDKYREEDYFNTEDTQNNNYNKASAFPKVVCPGEKSLEIYK